MIGKDIASVIFEDDLDFILASVIKVASEPDAVARLNYRVKTVNGVKWIEATGMNIEESGEPARIVFFREIEEPKNGTSFEIIRQSNSSNIDA